MFAIFGLFVALVSASPSTKSVYDFKVRNIDNKEESLSQYKGKVLLIVNTASRCGFTSQYEGLQKLYETYKDKGFVVLGFPSNDFAGQEPGSAAEIKAFCKANYGVSFPLFAKASVTGEGIQPLFKYLTNESPEEHRGKVRWNFAKFLVGRDGRVVDRFAPTTGPENASVAKAITKALGISYIGP